MVPGVVVPATTGFKCGTAIPSVSIVISSAKFPSPGASVDCPPPEAGSVEPEFAGVPVVVLPPPPQAANTDMHISITIKKAIVFFILAISLSAKYADVIPLT
jgi:hypothetical protein